MKKKSNLTLFMKQLIRSLKEEERFSTAHIYQSTLNAFMLFCKTDAIRFNQMERSRLKQFENHLRNRPPHHRSADKKLYGSGTCRQKRKGRPLLCRKQRGAHKVRQIFRRRENRNRAVRRKPRIGRQNAAFARDDFSSGGNCDKHGEKGRLYRVLARVSGEKRYARRDNIDRLRRRTQIGRAHV